MTAIKAGFKPVGLTLSDDDYQRLKEFADERHWSMALAARLIVISRLDKHDSGDDSPSGLYRGEGARETGADSP